MSIKSMAFTTSLLIALSSTNLNAWTGPQGVTFQQAVEFSTQVASGFTAAEPYSSVWHFKDSTYFTWVDTNHRAWVTQMTNGKVISVPVDAQADYQVQPDGHHRFSLGVDSAGYIHVTGDMHHYSNLTTSVINPYPVRYQKQTILYWKSNKPGDISGGFSYAGGLNAPTAIPGGGWMMGRFFTDNNGVLYYSSFVHAYESSTNAGQMAVGLYIYNTTTQTWKAIGGLADNGGQPYTINLFPVFYWELSGFSPSNWFQNYQPSFKFDTSNRMYFSVSGNTNSTINGANRLIYAYSDNNGTTWKKANGNIIPSLPIRGIDTSPNVGDVVADSGTTANTYGATVGLIIDKYGQQGVTTTVQGQPFNVWWSWNGKSWDQNNTQNYLNVPTNAMGFRLNDNNLVFSSSVVPKLMYSTSLTAPSYGYDLTGYSNFVNIDDFGARNYGVVWGVATNNTASTDDVVRTSSMTAPLPPGWACNDISATLPSYLGTCGYVNNAFVATNYEPSIAYSGTDSFFYIYRQIVGDGTFVTQVSSNPATSPVALMMRNTLDPTSVFSSVVFNNNSAAMYTRTSSGAKSFKTAGFTQKATTNWLKLVRKGDTFTGYASADAVTWTQLQPSSTIPMNQIIYVGMASFSSQAGWFMQNSTFSNASFTIK
jgi:hypothetical protein